MYNAHRRFFSFTEHFCIDNARVIDGKIRYLVRHDIVFTHLYYSICKVLCINTIKKYTHTQANMLKCICKTYGIKEYTQIEKL
jgi:hypothetical protein